MNRSNGMDARSRYLLLALLVVVVAVGGYVGYVLYPRFDLPAAQGMGLLGLAAAAGIAAFFSPCSFPLLLTLLTGRTITGDPANPPRPVRFGAALALGAAVFMTAVGVVIAAGGQALFANVTFTSTSGIIIRTIAGLVLVVFGLSQAEVLNLSMHRISRSVQPRFGGGTGPGRQSPTRRMAVFGFGYVLAGFG